jgi:endonuclease III
MGYALGRDVLAVDTHVARVMGRLGLVEPSPGKPDHGVFEAVVPKRIRVRFHMNLVIMAGRYAPPARRNATGAASRHCAGRVCSRSLDRGDVAGSSPVYE